MATLQSGAGVRVLSDMAQRKYSNAKRSVSLRDLKKRRRMRSANSGLTFNVDNDLGLRLPVHMRLGAGALGRPLFSVRDRVNLKISVRKAISKSTSQKTTMASPSSRISSRITAVTPSFDGPSVEEDSQYNKLRGGSNNYLLRDLNVPLPQRQAIHLQPTSRNPNTESLLLNYKVLVNNLHPSVTIQDVQELFSIIGKIRDITHLYPGTFLIIFYDQKDAAKACEKYHGCKLDGQPMLLRMCS